ARAKRAGGAGNPKGGARRAASATEPRRRRGPRGPASGSGAGGAPGDDSGDADGATDAIHRRVRDRSDAVGAGTQDRVEARFVRADRVVALAHRAELCLERLVEILLRVAPAIAAGRE